MPIDVTDTVLIVVGSELVPEEKDRPLGYRLKERFDQEGDGRFQRSIVVSDRWYLDNPIFQACPSIIIGGPGVNQAAAEFYDRIPVVWTQDQRAFIHFTLSDGDAKAALWGMNQTGTEEALQVFMDEGLLMRFIERVWKRS